MKTVVWQISEWSGTTDKWKKWSDRQMKKLVRQTNEKSSDRQMKKVVCETNEKSCATD